MKFFKSDFFKTTRFKTTLWYAGLFLVLEIVIGLIVYFHLRGSMYNDLDLSLSNQAESIYTFVSESKVDWMNFEADSVYSSKEDFVYDLIFDALVLNPRNSFVQVKVNNNLIFQSENLKKHEIILSPVNINQTRMVVFFDSFLSGQKARAACLVKNHYEIIVAFPTAIISETLKYFTDLNIIIGPIFLLLAIIGGAIISSKSLSRIDSIINKTKRITAQNLDEKIPGGDYDDEYGRLVRTMNDMILRIKTAVDYMNQFSVAASHELKTPLTILRGEIEVALKSPKPIEVYEQILKSNYEETIRLINVVDKLFFLSKVDHSLLNLKKERISIVKLIEPSINQMRPFAETKHMEVVLNLKDDFDLFVDIDLMRRAINNLIENAIKYGDEYTQIIVACGLEKPNEASISITNRGENIPKEFYEKIFERFFRLETSRSRETGGIGLGLSIVKSIIEFHKGIIELSSDKERETKFSILLKNDNK